MANDFDQFPIYDPLVKQATLAMSDVWVGAISYFYENLVAYLSQYGVFIPNITTAQRDTIQFPMEGQMIYNLTILAPQIFQNGVWKTFTTT